ncbi:putative ABC transporter, partial [Aureobasidium melanogenum]
MLPKVVLISLRWHLLAAIVPRLFLLGFTFAQPFLISATLRYINESESRSTKDYAYGLIAATLLIYVGIAISSVLFKQCLARIVSFFRGSMISLIYGHTLELRDGSSAKGAAVTLMSTDLDNIIEFLENIYNIWACVLEVAIGIWLLDRIVGATCIVPLVIVLVCAACQTLVAKSIGKDQQNWNKAIQARVQNTSHILGSMHSIKISGYAESVSADIQNQRIEELETSRPFFRGILYLNVLSSLPTIWSPFVTFVAVAVQALLRGRDSINTVQVFTSLSIINIVTSSAGKLLALLPQIAAALGCFKRIQDYLLSESYVDLRIYRTTRSSTTLEAAKTEPDGIKLASRVSQSTTRNEIVTFNKANVPLGSALRSGTTLKPTCRIPRGSITVLIGPTGSGKTTLLKAILGEIPCQSGEVFVQSKSMAYCSQTPFVLNGSVKKNICGPSGLDPDEIWYKAVLRACDLDHDIQRWDNQDSTIVGSKGIALSGGHKQRLALARAVYSRKELVLLDDVLSALDNRTRNTITSRLFSRTGVFKKLGATVILTAHSLQDLAFADHVLVLDLKGNLTPFDTYADAAADSCLELNAGDGNDQVDEELASTDGPTTSGPATEAQDQVGPETQLTDLTRSTGDFKLYAYYFRTTGWLYLITFLAVAATTAFAENFAQVWLNWWAVDNGKHLPKYLPVYAVLLLVATVCAPICLWIMFLRMMPKSAAALHWNLLRTVKNAPLSFLTATDSGITLNRFSQDMSLVDLALPIALSTFIMACFECIAKIGLIATGSSYMAISVPFALLTVAMVQHAYLKTSRQLRYLDLENKSPLFTHFTETSEGLTTIRAFDWQDEAMSKNNENLDNSQKSYYMLLCAQRWLGLVLDLIVAALAVMVVSLAVELRSTTEAGLLGVALNNILSFSQALSSVIPAWANLETSLGSIARVKSFVSTTPSETNTNETATPPPNWPTCGSIQLCDISVKYGDRKLALESVSLTINHGEKIGICGRTGSGKSTLINAILRIAPTQTGTITIDDIDISTLQPNILRSELIVVPQDPFTLPGTVRYNIDPLGKSSDAEIKTACEKVGIWSALDSRGGLHAILLDHPLSQGEQQLICLARGMLKKSTILILDEATSSVDGNIDLKIREVIKEHFADCTVLSVAHRLDTVLSSDRIVLLDEGRVLENDSPKNLLARDSMFRRLYRS